MPQKSLEERQAEMRERLTGGHSNEKPRPALVVKESEPITVSTKTPPQFEKRQNGQIAITRKALYRFVWLEPATKIAKRFGVSDVAIAKACRKNEIPLPGLGYWAKVAAGQKLRRPPLPKTSDDDDVIHFMPQPPSPKAEAAIVTSTREVPVPETARNLHPVVAKTYSVLREQVGSKPRRTYGTDYRRTWGPEGMLDIKVTEAQLSRTVRIMSAIFNAAEKAGHSVRVGDGPSWRRGKEVQIVADGVPMTFEVFEPVRGTKHIPTSAEQRDIDRGSHYGVPTYDYNSTGNLQLTMKSDHGGSRAWRDTRHQKLEDLLGVIIDTMPVFSKSEKEWLQQKAIEDKRQAEAQRLRWEEEKRVKRLEKQLTVWKKARDVRQYVQAVEDSAARRSAQVDPAGELGQWITWMRRYADRLDPSGRDDIGNEDAWQWW